VLSVDFQPAAGGEPEKRVIAPTERGEVRAPARAGLFTLRRDNEALIRGAAQFADPRQGDFRGKETFVSELPGAQQVAIERNTTPDPFATAWLVVLAALACASWWTRLSKTSADDRGGEGAPVTP